MGETEGIPDLGRGRDDHVQGQCSNKPAGSERGSWVESEVRLKL